MQPYPQHLWVHFTRGGPKKRAAPLCRTFQRMAIRTCGWLDNGLALSVLPAETSITDVQLFELAKLHPTEVSVRRYTGSEEGDEGADWEWYIGGAGGYYPMRVQAKKLNRIRDVYPDLLRQAGTSGKRQIDLLIQRAGSTAMPMYCFYNGLDGGVWPSPPTWAPSCFPPHPMAYGCTIARAHRVRGSMASGSTKSTDAPFGIVAPLSFPWSDLVCCPGLGATAAEIAKAVCEGDGDVSVDILSTLPARVERGEPPPADDPAHQNLIGTVVISPRLG